MKFTVKLLGKTWKVRFYTCSKFNKLPDVKGVDPDRIALTDGDARLFEFSLKSINEHSIVHELTHAYFYELCLGSTNITKEDLEEVFCEVVSRHGADINRLKKDIYRKARRLIVDRMRKGLET